MWRNCLSLLMQRSTRFRFLYLCFEMGMSSVLLDFGGITGVQPLVLDQLPDPVGIVSLVSQHIGSLGQVVKEKLGHRRIVHLVGRKLDLQKQLELIDPEMQLGGQSSP